MKAKKRHLKKGVKMTLLFVILAVLLVILFIEDYNYTKDNYNKCREANNNAYFCEDLRK